VRLSPTLSHRRADLGSAPAATGWTGVQQHLEARREARTERRYVKEQICAIRRETPAFAIREGVNPENDEPLPYINVCARMVHRHL
jgi:hypothetical protein